jgi:hypothetical protein
MYEALLASLALLVIVKGARFQVSNFCGNHPLYPLHLN